WFRVTNYQTSFPKRRSSDLMLMRNPEVMLLDTFEDPQFIHDLMRVTTDFCKTWGDAIAKTGIGLKSVVTRMRSWMNCGSSKVSRDRKSTRLNSSHQIISYAV